MKTGEAPQYLMAFAVATKVSDWVITSFPFSTPKTCKAVCKAAVPLTTATAFFTEQIFSNSASTLFTYGPTLDTNVLSIQSIKYCFSFPPKKGS